DYFSKAPSIYSLLRRAILATEIFFGHSASQALVLVQCPKPSSSMALSIATALCLLSDWPCGSKLSCETLADTNNIAELFLQAATQAPQPIQAAASKASSAISLAIGIEFASGALPVLTDI